MCGEVHGMVFLKTYKNKLNIISLRISLFVILNGKKMYIKLRKKCEIKNESAAEPQCNQRQFAAT